MKEWRDAVMTNRLDEVTLLVEDALRDQRAPRMRQLRGWMAVGASISAAELPGAAQPRETTVPLPAADPGPTPDPASATAAGPLISEIFAALLEARLD